MNNFCSKCGSLLKRDGKCPKCDVKTGPSKKSRSKELSPKALAFKKNSKKVFIVVLILLSIYTVSMVAVGTLVYMDKLNIPMINDMFIFMGWKSEKVPEAPLPSDNKADNKDKEKDKEQKDPVDISVPYEVPVVDAEKYYSENATGVTKTDANSSQNTLSESDAYDLFQERGFTNISITTNYDMNGNYSADRTISSYSSAKHPMYHALYVSSAGIPWSIYCTDGQLMAVLLVSLKEGVSTVVSESSTLTSYDNISNCFYVSTPNSDVMDVKTVGTLNAQTLNNLSLE